MSTTSHTTSRGFKHWSDRDDAAIREMFHEGYSDDVIAGALGRTVKAIELRRIRLELRNAARPRATGKPTGPRPLTSGQLSEIQRHLDGGLDAVAIAALMSLPERTVQQAINNHNMIALPPRNVYRPPVVRSVPAEPAPAAEPFEHRRMLHPDAPISLPVVEPERTPQVVDESKWVALADAHDAAKVTTTQNGYWDYPEPALLDTPSELSIATETTPDCQAEPSVDSNVPINQSVDSTAACQPSNPWQIYEPHRQRTGLWITLRRSGDIAVSAQAITALGSRAVLLLWDEAGQRIGIRATTPEHPHALKLCPDNTVHARAFLNQRGIEYAERRTLPAEMVEGVLVVAVGV